ncbi:HD domain-containing phosphohydrolase [Candidatus Omnitrophota bacterium]
MNEFRKKESKEFLSKFCKSSPMLLFKEAFSEVIGKNVECLFFDSECAPLVNKKKSNKHVARFLKELRTYTRKEMIRVFNCPCDKSCLAVPIIQGDRVYGYALALHLKNLPDKNALNFMKLFIDIALKEFQKSEELTKLYDTIRPRAIALSTIHTIHRLLSSTLDMDELIERMARLTSQVIRTRSCSIMLLDKSRNYLVPKAVIDFKNSGGKTLKRRRKIKIGTGVIGKVVKTGKTNLSRNSICVPLVEEDIIGVICAANKTNNDPFNKFDTEILLTLAEQAVIALRNAQLYEEQKKMAYGSIKSLAALLDAKSPHTYTHCENFAKIILSIAEEMRLPREEIGNLRYAALLPDTGKFAIPDEILKKRSGLSKKEYTIIKKQHLEALKILKPLEFLKPALPTIIYHHERYDGTGYPEGLKGRQIPIGARIMAVADAFEAMVYSRPYKDTKISIAQALKEIESNKGTQFDPDVVDAFVSVSKKQDFKELF